MTQPNDLTARRVTNRLRLLVAHLVASGLLVISMAAVDVVADGALNQPWSWGGVVAVLIAYHSLSALSARLLLGWQRRAIQRMVGQPDKRAVTTLRAVQVVDLPPDSESPWWMSDSTSTGSRSQAGA